MIYFIQADKGGPVKIGYSATRDSVQGRLGSLQTGSHEHLKLLLVLDGSQAEERALHERFGPYRLHGEWFECAGSVAAFIYQRTMSPPVEEVRETIGRWLQMGFIDGGCRLTAEGAVYLMYAEHIWLERYPEGHLDPHSGRELSRAWAQDMPWPPLPR